MFGGHFLWPIFLKKQNEMTDFIFPSMRVYSPETKNTRHKSFRKIGFVDALIEQGIDDPISHFQKEVNELNSKRETEKCRINFQQISDISPELCLGYVPIAKILNMLDKRTFWVFKFFKEVRVRCI